MNHYFLSTQKFIIQNLGKSLLATTLLFSISCSNEEVANSDLESDATTSEANVIDDETGQKSPPGSPVDPEENRTYYIKNVNSDKFLDVDNRGSTKNGTNVHQWAYHGLINQRFRLIKNGGRFQLKAANSLKVVDVQGYSKNNYGNVHMWDNNKTNNQKWSILGVNEDEKIYIFKNVNSSKVLEVARYSKDDGGNVSQYRYMKLKSQQWQFYRAD